MLNGHRPYQVALKKATFSVISHLDVGKCPADIILIKPQYSRYRSRGLCQEGILKKEITVGAALDFTLY